MVIRKSKNPALLEARTKVFKFFDENEEKYFAWFETPNPLLGGVAPDEMIRCGRVRKLVDFINTSLGENRTEE